MKARPVEAVSASRNSRPVLRSSTAEGGGNEAHTLKKSEPPSAFAKLRCDQHVGGYGFERGSIELSIATNAGQFVARYSGKGLAELDFPSVGRASSVHCRRRGNESQISSASSASVRDSSRRLLQIPTKIRNWHQATTAALKNVLARRSPGKFPPLDLAGTEFQKTVWNALRKIPLGKTKSYGEIARAIGRPRAVRAVGGACGANPIPVLVPCHRVLAANKKLGGFSGGLNRKRELLAREGIKF
jgi:O-6-methylguanine DNA methyltransferase